MALNGRERAAFRRDVLEGLAARPKRIPPKYLYDEAGSALFDRICGLDEYYLTRAETAILREAGPAIAAAIGPDGALIEYGAGSALKASFLLRALEHPAVYCPIDLANEALGRLAAKIERAFPGLAVRPIHADYTRRLRLPREARAARRRVAWFPGSTIGNLEPREATGLLRSMARAAGADGVVLVGVDLHKDPSVLHRAYNDRAGVTAAFNRNVLERINRELGGDFDPASFDHYAFYEPRHHRIEMHLVSRRPQTVTVAATSFSFDEGETVWTESSYKYTLDAFQRLARRAGLEPGPPWTDAEWRFAVFALRPQPAKERAASNETPG